MSALKPFKFNNVFRDGIQSNLGTNPSADEMLEMIGNPARAGYDSVQAGGGTFLALFVDKGREEWSQITKLLGAFKGGIPATALFRGDCIMGYDRSPQDVIDATVEAMAERGLKEITNFHGLNDARMQAGVFRAVRKAREKGYDITAPKVICIEYNPNITVKSCMAALAVQEAWADRGIYIKNANGKVSPDLVYDLVRAIAKKYPGEEITLHSHNNHGLAYAIYLAGIEAAAESGADLALDVLPRPLAEGTAQPSAERVQEMIERHPDARVRDRACAYDSAKEAPLYPKIYALRFRYRHAETRYSKSLYDELYKAGMAGGATSTVKGITGMLPNLMAALKTGDEEEAFIALCGMEHEVKEILGHPTSVTPYQKMLTEAAAFELIYRSLGKAPFENLTEAVQNYLAGGLGQVPEGASKELQRRALKMKGFENIPPFVPASELPPAMAAAEKELKKAGLANPRRTDVITAAMLGGKGFEHVLSRFKGEADAQKPPALPPYLSPPFEGYKFAEGGNAYPYDVAMALGGAAALEQFAQSVLEIEKFTDGFYKTGLNDEGQCYTRTTLAKADKPVNGDGSAHAGMSAREAYLCDLYKRWHAQGREEAAGFIEDIPARLKKAGLSSTQAVGAMEQVRTILSDVVNTKAKNAARRSLPALDASKISKGYNAAVTTRQERPEPVHFEGLFTPQSIPLS